MAASDIARQVLAYWMVPNYEAVLGRYGTDGSIMKKWFMGGEAVDKEIKERFSSLLGAMRAGRLDHWQTESPETAVAGIILLDQFPRNMYRGTPAAFETDGKALQWSEHLLASGSLESMPRMMHLIALLPLMHAEDLAVQQRCVSLHQTLLLELQQHLPEAEGLAEWVSTAVKFAQDHADIIQRFGRFPHRNLALGRPSTAEEEQGLKDGSIKSF